MYNPRHPSLELANKKQQNSDDRAYFWVDMKFIFHFPTLPEPCWVAVRAGE